MKLSVSFTPASKLSGTCLPRLAVYLSVKVTDILSSFVIAAITEPTIDTVRAPHLNVARSGWATAVSSHPTEGLVPALTVPSLPSSAPVLISPAFAPSLWHGPASTPEASQPTNARDTEAVCDPVYSPASRLSWHFTLASPTVSSVTAAPFELKRFLAAGHGCHSYLPVSAPALIVVQAALSYLPVAVPSFKHLPISGSSGEAV